jgi:hypothetical protein
MWFRIRTKFGATELSHSVSSTNCEFLWHGAGYFCFVFICPIKKNEKLVVKISEESVKVGNKWKLCSWRALWSSKTYLTAQPNCLASKWEY